MTWGAPAATTRGHAYAQSNTDIKKTPYKEQLLSSHLHNSEHLGTSVPDVPKGDVCPRTTTSTSFFTPRIFSCIWRMRVCLFAHCDCNQFRAYSVRVFSPHIAIAISFGRIVSVFAVRLNLTAPCLTAKGRVMESGESDSELRSHDIISDTPHMAPSTGQSGASHNNTITHSSPTWAGTLHHAGGLATRIGPQPSQVTGAVAHIAKSTAMKMKCFAPEDKMSMAVQNLIFAYQLILNVPHIVSYLYDI